MLDFVRGNPNKKKGKAILYFRNSETLEIYAFIISRNQLELLKIEGFNEEVSMKRICENKEKVPFGYYFVDKGYMNSGDFHSQKYKDFELIYCGRVKINQFNDLLSSLSAALNEYNDSYEEQKNFKEPTLIQISKLNSQLKEVFYGDSYKDYKGDDLRKRVHTHLACLLDSINFDNEKDREDRLFKIKVFFKGFPCKDIVSKLLDVSQQKMPSKRKYRLMSLLSDEIIAIRDENYESAKKIKNKLKRFKRNFSKDI